MTVVIKHDKLWNSYFESGIASFPLLLHSNDERCERAVWLLLAEVSSAGLAPNMDDEDDLDELLDEVEKKFCRNVSVASVARVEPSKAGKSGKDNEGQKKHR